MDPGPSIGFLWRQDKLVEFDNAYVDGQLQSALDLLPFGRSRRDF